MSGRSPQRRITLVLPLAFLEQLAQGQKRIDPDAGVIRGVKVLGLESANGRKYLPDAIKKAVKLYEGAPVRTDHPARAGDGRKSAEVFGWLQDARVAEDGCLYADLYVLTKHERAACVFEAAAKNPKLYGLSHNIACESKREGQIDVISEITEVFSVDLVADPATTNGLFEGKHVATKTTFGKYLETVLPRLTAKKGARLQAWLEGEPDVMQQEMEPEADPAEADPNAALKEGFKSACMPLLDAALDGDADALKQLTDFVKTHAKISAKPEAPAEEDEGDEEEEPDDKPKESKKGKGAAKDKRGLTEAYCAKLVKNAGLKADAKLNKSLAKMGDLDDILEHLDYLKTLAPAGKGSGARSTEAGSGGSGKGTTTATESKVPSAGDAKALASWLND